MSKPTNYRELSASEKREESLRRIREPGVQCPVCETKCGVDDLLAHVQERCPGPREPHPHARWITAGKAVELGANRRTLYRWAKTARVRTKVEDGYRMFLFRDVARRIAESSDTNDTPPKRMPKGLPKRRGHDRTENMSGALETTVIDRLRAYAAELGGLAALSRRMDVPVNTLRRAVAGGTLRRGTRELIERAIADKKGD